MGASVAKEMCFQRSSERIEGKSRPPQSGWKIVPQSRTGCRETPIDSSGPLIYLFKTLCVHI